jgi:TPR repeat protein
LFDINNIDEAKFYLEKSVQINDTLCLEFYADLLFTGKYFDKNYNSSRKYYLKAKSFGSISAERKLLLFLALQKVFLTSRVWRF